MINVAEKLKDCPKGTKLYSPMFGEVELDRINIGNYKFPIIVRVLDNGIPYSSVGFTAEGKWYNTEQSECLLFPSKDNRDWNKFRIPVKRGDIMMIPNSDHAFITTGEFTDNASVMFICGVDEDNELCINPGNAGWTKGFYIPASEEAKKKLFDKMEAAGYRWNADTLKLEKIEPSMFKEGNVLIKYDTLFLSTGIIKNNIIRAYCLRDDGTFMDCDVSISSSLKLASVTDRNKLFSVLTKRGYKYDKEQHKLIKQEFKPFDKVLVRDDIDEKWILSIFGCYEDEVDKDFPYVCINGRYCYCIPYEGNEHLLGTPSTPKDY